MSSETGNSRSFPLSSPTEVLVQQFGNKAGLGLSLGLSSHVRDAIDVKTDYCAVRSHLDLRNIWQFDYINSSLTLYLQ